MAECLDCSQSLSLEDILRLTMVCDESGNVSFRAIAVEYSGDCSTCGEYNTVEELLRKSLYCEDGLWYIQVVLPA